MDLISPSPAREKLPATQVVGGQSWAEMSRAWLKWFDSIRFGLNSLLYEREISNVTTSTITLTDSAGTIVVMSSGAVVTLPPASTARIGKRWTIILGIAGYADIYRAGSDTFILPVVSTSIRLDTKGSSITLECLSASSWGIV